MSVYWILLPQLGISLVNWAQLVLSMNQYRGLCRFSRVHVWSLLLSLFAGVVRWVSQLAIRTETLGFQLVAAFVGSGITWTCFVLVFNQDFEPPTRQQATALLLSLVVTSLWEVSNRLAFGVDG